MLDIEYLLLLQRFRIAINDALTPFFEWLSNFAVSYLLLVPVYIYWAIHKKKGYYVLSGYAIVSAAVALIKLCVCAYRPWIRSPLIEPAGDSKVAATGYSFPSGHTVLATNHYGGIGRIEYKKRNWITYLCVFLILLTGFSRNYLGVHTPQDVFVAIVLAVAVLIFTERLLKYLDE
ncbi:MAG: phosphatase PAP2 family protein, partial [Erysipelotrichaceae bacterium]|nr:phosphatase PAP2 family protein [Erysipelotrichaceae bacterium]